jgi:virginiamycin A acetyltransferase
VREQLKTCLRGIAFLAVVPALVSYRIKSIGVGKDAALESSSQALGLIPGLTGQYLRRAFLSRVLAGCHSHAVIGFGTVFSQSGSRIDENAYIGPHCHLGLVHVESDALIASGVHVPSGRYTHGIDDESMPPREQAGRPIMVRIGSGAWIGSNAVVLADVGAGTIVGAGSVVTRVLPARVVAAGVPARVLRERVVR